MIPNPLGNLEAGPLADFIRDPVVNLRRRMTAVLSEISELLIQHRNRDEMMERLADWFTGFRSAVFANEDIPRIVNTYLPLLQTLLDVPQFRAHPTVQIILNQFIPQMRRIFGPQILPNLPQMPPVAPNLGNQNADRLAEIRGRVLGNQARWMQMDVDIRQQQELQFNVAVQQGFDELMARMQQAFEENMERLDIIHHEDQQRIQRGHEEIDALEHILAHVENALPNLENRVLAAHRALDHLGRAIEQAKQDIVQLQQAIDKQKEAESGSFLSTIGCIAACIFVTVLTSGYGATITPNLGGAKLSFTFTF